jgi:glycosyltransferase involved in cell wall biosynthesis
LADLVKAQHERGCRAAALVHEAIGPCSAPRERSWLFHSPVWFRPIFAPISPVFPFWLARIIRTFEPDVLHLHLPNLSAFFALLLPSARAIPWVIHWQSDVEPSKFSLGLRLTYPHYRIFETALLDHASAVIVTSPQYLKTSRPLQRSRHKCHVIPLGIDPGRLKDVPKSECAGLWGVTSLRVLSIGRLTYYKGFETLIEAVAGIDDWELVIIGEGGERAKLERLCARLGNPKNIRLVGALDDPVCQAYLSSCDVFCLPSRERTESFGIVLM